MNRTQLTIVRPMTELTVKGSKTCVTYNCSTSTLNTVVNNTLLKTGGNQTVIFKSAVTGPRGPKGDPGDSNMYWTTTQW